MNRDELLRLARLSHLSPRELRAEDDELAEVVDEQLAERTASLVATRLTRGDGRVRDAVRSVRLRPDDIRGRRPIGRVLLDRLGEEIDDEETITEISEGIHEASSEFDGALIAEDIPLAVHPEFRERVETANFLEAAASFDLDGAVDPLLERDVPLHRVDATGIERLVDERIIDRQTAATLSAAASTYRALDENPGLVRAAADALGVDGLQPRDLVTLDADGFRELVDEHDLEPPRGMTIDAWAEGLHHRVTNLFPTAGLAASLGRTSAELPGGVELDELKAFLERNAEAELLTLDLEHGSEDLAAIDFGDVEDDQRDRLLGSARAYQRVWTVTDDVLDAERIVGAGYHTAVSIAAEKPERLATETSLEARTVELYADKARKVATKVAGYAGTILDLLHGGFVDTAVGNMSTDIESYLAELPGFDDLFGALAFCDCKHCRSILSPAAYFVDLMCFIEEEITTEFFADHEDHPLKLKTRRPDLWSLQLTCENTHELVPYLEIINEILENAVATESGFGGDLEVADRSDVLAHVYGTALLEAEHSFEQPFHLPVEQLKIYLSHFERQLADVGQALGRGEETVARLDLDLSTENFAVLTTPAADLATLQTRYGLAFSESAGTIEPFDAQDLVGATGLSRDQLGRVLGTWYVTEGFTVDIQIVGEKRSPESIQNDIERVHDLTVTSLDRLHRFTRLWRALGWQIEEVDLVLEHLDSDITQSSCIALEKIRRVRETLELDVDQTVTLFSTTPDRPSRDDEASLFDRTFNIEFFARTLGTLPGGAPPFLHPKYRDTPTDEPDPNTARLVAGLRVDEERLGMLIDHLAAELGVDPEAGTEADRRFTLDVGNLTLLHRHALLLGALGVEPDELFRACALAPELAADHVSGLDDAVALVRFHRWFDDTEWSLDDLEAIVHGGDELPDAGELATAVVDQVDAQEMLVFASTVFAFVEDVTEAQSQEILDANAAVLEQLEDGRYRLTDAFDPTAALTVPGSVAAAEPDLRAVLTTYWCGEILEAVLPGHLDVTPGALTGIVDLLGEDLADAVYMRVLRGDDDASALIALIETILPLALLWGADVFDEAAVEFMGAHPDAFADADWTAVDVDAVIRVSWFGAWLEDVADDQREAFLDALADFDDTIGFDAAGRELIAELLDVPGSLTSTVQEQIRVDTDLFATLRRLRDSVALCDRLGIGGTALGGMASDDYALVSSAASALVAAMHTRYTEAEWEEKVQPQEDRLLSRRRDGLVDYLVRSSAPQFDEPSDLYHYYLLDVELEGCARTSRVVAANSSLQLYVQRCRLNLERSPFGADDAVAVSPTAVTKEQWSWRKNYRVWEANRKVFLYPENYIEPELRDNKSPMFETLEEELLAQEINADTVRDAYARYLKSFVEVSNLKIAGTWHEKDEENDVDVLHLFGVTAGDPPTYYYRRVENIEASETEEGRPIHWSPWRKVDVQIDARKVTPVVFQGRLHVFWTRYTTKPRSEFVGNETVFLGYRHTMSLHYTVRNLDGSWTSPQQVRLNGAPFDTLGDGLINDSLGSDDTPVYDDEEHPEHRDAYTLEGLGWDRVVPFVSDERVVVRGRNFEMFSNLDFYDNDLGPRMLMSAGYGVPAMDLAVAETAEAGGAWGFPAERVVTVGGSDRREVYATPTGVSIFESNTLATLASDQAATGTLMAVEQWRPEAMAYLVSSLRSPKDPLFDLPDGDTLEPVLGSPADVVVQSNGDLLLLQEGVRDDGDYNLRRLNTSVAEEIARVLFSEGVDALLDVRRQLEFAESEIGLEPDASHVHDATGPGELDYSGPMGLYLREIFFHIPFLIANHLNSQGEYEEAQDWYHYIFDPTAADETEPAGDLDEDEAERRARNRVWRYREFRELELDSLREQLTDDAAVSLYERDPFNPHAIARMRLTAYQKTILMKYVDNLLDWGDSLFSRFTMESINEASLLYVMAQELLGDRPPEIGECGEVDDAEERTFEAIKPNLSGDFLAELETLVIRRYRRRKYRKGPFELLPFETSRRHLKKAYARQMRTTGTTRDALALDPFELKVREVDSGRMAVGRSGDPVVFEAGKSVRPVDKIAATLKWKKPPLADDIVFRPKGKYDRRPKPSVPPFGTSVTRHLNPVFCVPKNETLLEYWDRVDDRLFKIRNCMTIDGVKKLPSLFAPPIDPGLLVKARAAGLSLQDALDATGGNLPPYRFRYLVEKARQHVGTLQSFGSALQTALEKRDAEELATIRNTHRTNLLKLEEDLQEQNLEAARQNVTTLDRRLAAAKYRRGHYDSLLNIGLLGVETMADGLQITTSVLRGTAGVLNTVGAITYLVPQVGSPFAMKYGGDDIGDSGTTWAEVLNSAASVTSAMTSAARTTAGFGRRIQGWLHQRKLADHEIERLESEHAAAIIRREIAEARLEKHRKSQEQHDEIIDFYESKFSDLGLYTWLSRELQQLYREAYNSALGFVRLAERAYRFERDDDSLFIDGAWDASRHGLLAGEQLMTSLNKMEKRFIETNYRSIEVNQSFSLAQIDPGALLALKQDGECEFSIPEFFFDLFYPGQYRRRIKAVRLTIPCVTGPYTNVSARLELVSSSIRTDADTSDAAVVDVPPMRTTSVATSTAQGDAGVFELNFRDERYMPFEGAGAVSTWKLSLPRHLRPFDYATINDVILNISYTAEEDLLFRDEVEGQTQAAEGILVDWLENTGMTRVLSLRQEFSDVFHRLTHSDAGTTLDLEISERHFPLFLQGRQPQANATQMVLVVDDDADVTDVAFEVDGNATHSFVPDGSFAELPAQATNLNAPLKGTHSVVVTDAGELAIDGNDSRLDPELLEDVLLVIDYGL